MNKSRLLGAVCAYSISTLANAALVGRLPDINGNYQAYYDDVMDITWAQNAYATSGHYYNVVSFINNYSIDGIYGWRMASVDLDRNDVIQRCSATVSSCPDNEFSYHYWANGISWDAPGVFSDVRTKYWTRDRWYGGANHAYTYAMRLSSHGHSMAGLNNAFYGWAVHDGDVTPVPIPASVWLFGSGLLGLVGIARNISA